MGNEVLNLVSQFTSQESKKLNILDATLGGGGHSALFLKNYPNVQIVGIDQDPIAREAAAENLKSFASKIKIYGKNFADFQPKDKFDIVLADLGVNSNQLDDAKRGFSFKSNGLIDMRMNPETSTTAADLLVKLNEKELANLIYEFGEERFSRRIAKKIKADISLKGNYKDTKHLAYAIAGCYPAKLRYGRIHPATKTFQALRIRVNNEMKALESLLNNAPDWLLSGGIFVVISFHSLEDRKVKVSFKSDNRLKILTKKPIIPTLEEIHNNPRSRSAKMRLAMAI